MNKKLIALSALVALALPVVSLAVEGVGANPPATTVIGIVYIINQVVNIVWWVFIAIAIILFLVTGILFLNAHGDPGKLETARQALIWGTVGVFVGIIAFSIIFIVKNAFLLN